MEGGWCRLVGRGNTELELRGFGCLSHLSQDSSCQVGKVVWSLVLSSVSLPTKGEFICKVICSSNILMQIDEDTILENKDWLNHFRKMAYFTDFYDAKKSFIGKIVFQSRSSHVRKL